MLLFCCAPSFPCCGVRGFAFVRSIPLNQPFVCLADGSRWTPTVTEEKEEEDRRTVLVHFAHPAHASARSILPFRHALIALLRLIALCSFWCACALCLPSLPAKLTVLFESRASPLPFRSSSSSFPLQHHLHLILSTSPLLFIPTLLPTVALTAHDDLTTHQLRLHRHPSTNTTALFLLDSYNSIRLSFTHLVRSDPVAYISILCGLSSIIYPS